MHMFNCVYKYFILLDCKLTDLSLDPLWATLCLPSASSNDPVVFSSFLNFCTCVYMKNGYLILLAITSITENTTKRKMNIILFKKQSRYL